MDKPAFITREMLEYLDELRESGEVNMFGATPYIQEEFELNAFDARSVMLYWMQTFRKEIE